jgi:hypothetical protein
MSAMVLSFMRILTLCRLQMRKSRESQSRCIWIPLSLVIDQCHHRRPRFRLLVFPVQPRSLTKRTRKIIRIHHFTDFSPKTQIKISN